MPGPIERDHDLLAEFRNTSVVFARESSPGEKSIHFRNGRRRVSKRTALRHDLRGELFQDARDLCRFLLSKLHQTIVDLDGLQRFDENGLAGSAGGMDYAFQAPPLRGADRDHVTAVALRDVIIAALTAAGAQNALERLLQ